jgi:hypothetical protein
VSVVEMRSGPAASGRDTQFAEAASTGDSPNGRSARFLVSRASGLAARAEVPDRLGRAFRLLGGAGVVAGNLTQLGRVGAAGTLDPFAGSYFGFRLKRWATHSRQKHFSKPPSG